MFSGIIAKCGEYRYSVLTIANNHFSLRTIRTKYLGVTVRVLGISTVFRQITVSIFLLFSEWTEDPQYLQGSLLETEFWAHKDLLNQNLHLNKIHWGFRQSSYIPKFEKQHCSGSAGLHLASTLESPQEFKSIPMPRLTLATPVVLNWEWE